MWRRWPLLRWHLLGHDGICGSRRDALRVAARRVARRDASRVAARRVSGITTLCFWLSGLCFWLSGLGLGISSKKGPSQTFFKQFGPKIRDSENYFGVRAAFSAQTWGAAGRETGIGVHGYSSTHTRAHTHEHTHTRAHAHEQRSIPYRQLL